MKPARALCGAALALALAGCASGVPAGTASAQPVAIATTTQLGSVLADIAGCAGTTSATLMGPGDDPHDFSLSSSEVASLVKTRLVVANGLGLEAGLSSVLTGAEADGSTIYEVAPHLDPRPYVGATAAPPAREVDHAHGAYDPHVHMDVARMARAAGLIGAELARATGDQRYVECGDKVSAELDDVDAEVRRVLAPIPEDRRTLVTDHEAYNYFAAAYDFRIAGVLVPGGSTDAAPGSAELARLVGVVREEGVSAIIGNTTTDSRLVEAIAREAGTHVRVVELFEGSLGAEGSGAETYAGMMRTNAARIAAALTQQ